MGFTAGANGEEPPTAVRPGLKVAEVVTPGWGAISPEFELILRPGDIPVWLCMEGKGLFVLMDRLP